MLTWKNKTRMVMTSVRYRLTRRKTPINVMLAVTDRCPSRCRYCQIPARNYPDIPLDSLLSLVDQMAGSGVQRIGLWGGEPLIRPDIGRIIARVKEKGIYVTMDSNGYFVPDKIDEILGLDHLVIALDGPEAAHDANREPGSHARALAAIEAAHQKIQTWTITVLTRNNLDSVPYILEIAGRYGLLCTFQILHHNNILSRNKDLLIPANDDYRRVIGQLLTEKKRGAPIASSSTYLNHLLRWPDYRTVTARHSRDGYDCLGGRLFCNIDTDGSLYPCSLLVGEIEAPNVFTEGFAGAWMKLGEIPCEACVAGCFTEYSHLYGLHLPTIWQWLRAMRRSRIR